MIKETRRKQNDTHSNTSRRTYVFPTFQETLQLTFSGSMTLCVSSGLKADSYIACRAHAMQRHCPAPTVPCPSWKSAW